MYKNIDFVQCLIGCFSINFLKKMDKIHPYSPEANRQGITSGSKSDIFESDFGKVGMVICADSWVNDIAELLGLI